MRKQKGFTLIELLVVIAIIGILSAIVLASLNSARNKAKDASAQSSMSSVRADAELYYSNAGAQSYGAVTLAAAPTLVAGVLTNAFTGACNDADVQKLLIAASGQTPLTITCTVGSVAAGNTTAGESYAAYAKLSGSATDHGFCVDSNNFSGDVQVTGTGATYVAGVAGTLAKCK